MNDPLEFIVAFLKQTDELAVASTLLKTFKKYSSSLEQYDMLGKMFNDVKDYDEAIDCAHRTLVMGTNPLQMRSARANLAKMYNHKNNPEKALQYINANLAQNPDDFEAKMEKLFSLYLSGKPQESYQIVKELLSDPNAPETIRNRCLFNSGSYLMDEGKFKEGIRNFIDVGHKIGIWNNAPLPGKVWDGKFHEGKTIAIFAEGGIGDEIINIRFTKNIEAMGMKALWLTNRSVLIQVFNRNGFTAAKNIPEGINQDDLLWCYSFYLPILLDLDKDQLDHGVYLTPSAKYVEKWKGILPEGKKIALRWSGNPHYEQDLARAISLKQYIDAFGDVDATFISVQKDHDLSELSNYPDVFDASPYLETIDDLLACLSLCDATVSSCTSVAHVAASSGCRLFVFPPIACYYVWLGEGNDWYSSHVTVNRQRNHKDWSFIGNIKDDLVTCCK